VFSSEFDLRRVAVMQAATNARIVYAFACLIVAMIVGRGFRYGFGFSFIIGAYYFVLVNSYRVPVRLGMGIIVFERQSAFFLESTGSNSCVGRAMAQAVSLRSPTAQVWVQSRVTQILFFNLLKPSGSFTYDQV
jgi:hypothetical protein